MSLAGGDRMRLVRCPACGSPALSVFHEQDGVPVQSCRLVATHSEAERFPVGALRIAVCTSCGFIMNTAFQPSRIAYDQYEDAQGFSPRFREFARELAEGWIERNGLRGATVLEIGSGKGDFLTLLCELGVRRGVAVDPAGSQARLAGKAAARVEIIADVYREEYAGPHVDAIVCRHTLEHIQDVAEFLKLVRRSIPAESVPVLFEVPDTMRILREGAFWDVYYEHCSYFTRGSLARLFRDCGFAVTSTSLVYDGQYVILEAHAGTPAPPDTDEETAEEIASEAATFLISVTEARARWRGRFDRFRASGARVAIWGAGSKTVAFLTTLALGNEVGCIVDVNPYKHGAFIAGTGHRISAPIALREYRPDVVLVMNPVYRAEIADDLERMGLHPELIAT